jgi:DNA sulfur modification protein DndE
MKPPIDAIRLTATERDVLVRIKKYTGISGYNVICRWSLLAGLAGPATPVDNSEKRDALEIRWDTFAGAHGDAIGAVIHKSYHSFTQGGGRATISGFTSAALASGLKKIAHATRGPGILGLARLK